MSHFLPRIGRMLLSERVLTIPLTIVLAFMLALASNPARATTITFDERPWKPGPEGNSFDTDPITTEYDALNVRFTDGYLQPSGPGSSQTLLGGPNFTVGFVGTLPRFVSLTFFGVVPPGASFVSAIGADGISTFSTGGVSYPTSPGGPPSETPFHPVVHASFKSQAGISGLTFGSFFSTRITGQIDNLYFGNVPAVPEPSTVVLMVSGLGMLIVGRRLRRRISYARRCDQPDISSG